MTDYKNPRPLPTDSAADPCVIYDNAVSFDKVINTDSAVTTYKGKQLVTLSQAINRIDWSLAGKFADGVTFTKSTDFALDGSNVQWIYVGSDPFPKTVAAGFVPAAPDYQVIHAGSLQSLSGLADTSDLDLVYSRTFNDISDLQSGIDASGNLVDMSQLIGRRVQWSGYYSQSDGGSNWGYVRSGAHTHDGGSIFTVSPTVYVEANFGSKIYAAKFGCQDNVEQTQRLQAALNYSNASSKPCVKLIRGTSLISMASSSHSNACLVIPKQTKLSGYGKKNSIVTRPSGERGVNGILLVNKGYDTETSVLSADGDLEFEDFTITDGAASPTRTMGDLIGIGNCENVKVKNVHFGVHDQHGVDIAGCKNVIITKCSGLNNNDGTYNRSATIQVDGANQGMFGQADVTYVSEDVFIYKNNFKNLSSLEVLHVGHKPQSKGTFKNIVVTGNILDGAYISDAIGIYIDPDVAFDSLDISSNIITINHARAIGINTAITGNAGAGDKLQNSKVSLNTIKGTGRVGIYFGASTHTNAAVPANIRNNEVCSNVVDITTDAPVIAYGMGVNGTKNTIVSNNAVRIMRSSGLFETKGIRVGRCLTTKVTSNNVEVIVSDASPANIAASGFYGIEYDMTMAPNVLTSSVVVEKNSILQSFTKYALYVSSAGFNNGVDKLVFSGNTFYGDLIASSAVASLFDAVGASDLTNGGNSVVFSGGSTSLSLTTTMDVQGVTYGGIKSFQGKVRLEPTFFETGVGYDTWMPLQLASGFSGTVFQAKTKDNFVIRTGSAGVNNYGSITGVATARPTSTLTIKAFI